MYPQEDSVGVNTVGRGGTLTPRTSREGAPRGSPPEGKDVKQKQRSVTVAEPRAARGEVVDPRSQVPEESLQKSFCSSP